MEKTRKVRLRDGKKIDDMFSGVDRIPVCDGRTDGVVRTMHMHRAVKTALEVLYY